jgi:hypothetical protein
MTRPVVDNARDLARQKRDGRGTIADPTVRRQTRGVSMVVPGEGKVADSPGGTPDRRHPRSAKAFADINQQRYGGA